MRRLLQCRRHLNSKAVVVASAAQTKQAEGRSFAAARVPAVAASTIHPPGGRGVCASKPGQPGGAGGVDFISAGVEGSLRRLRCQRTAGALPCS